MARAGINKALVQRARDALLAQQLACLQGLVELGSSDSPIPQ